MDSTLAEENYGEKTLPWQPQVSRLPIINYKLGIMGRDTSTKIFFQLFINLAHFLSKINTFWGIKFLSQKITEIWLCKVWQYNSYYDTVIVSMSNEGGIPYCHRLACVVFFIVVLLLAKKEHLK